MDLCPPAPPGGDRITLRQICELHPEIPPNSIRLFTHEHCTNLPAVTRRRGSGRPQLEYLMSEVLEKIQAWKHPDQSPGAPAGDRIALKQIIELHPDLSPGAIGAFMRKHCTRLPKVFLEKGHTRQVEYLTSEVSEKLRAWKEFGPTVQAASKGSATIETLPVLYNAPAFLISIISAFEDPVRGFLQWLSLGRSANTARGYGQGLLQFMKFLKLRGITHPDQVGFLLIEQFMLWQRQGGANAKTVNHRLCVIRSFWKWMRRAGYVTTNPGVDVERLRVGFRSPRFLTVPDQERLLAGVAAAEGDKARRDEAMIATALLTGLRCGELVHVRMEDFDLESATLRVAAGKGLKDRDATIILRLDRILRAYLPCRERLAQGVPTPWLFLSASRTIRRGAHKFSQRPWGEPMCTQAFFRLLREQSRRVLNRDVSPHALRHSFATRLREAGADLQLIQELLGHADINTTTIYAHLTTARRHKLVQQFLS